MIVELSSSTSKASHVKFLEGELTLSSSSLPTFISLSPSPSKILNPNILWSSLLRIWYSSKAVVLHPKISHRRSFGRNSRGWKTVRNLKCSFRSSFWIESNWDCSSWVDHGFGCFGRVWRLVLSSLRRRRESWVVDLSPLKTGTPSSSIKKHWDLENLTWLLTEDFSFWHFPISLPFRPSNRSQFPSSQNLGQPLFSTFFRSSKSRSRFDHRSDRYFQYKCLLERNHGRWRKQREVEKVERGSTR